MNVKEHKAQLAKKHRQRFGRFETGPMHILNPVPQNAEEAIQHGNAMAALGNYPVGTSDCFNVGISGGCGPDCFAYQDGRCDEPAEIDAMVKEEALRSEQSQADQ